MDINETDEMNDNEMSLLPDFSLLEMDEVEDPTTEEAQKSDDENKPDDIVEETIEDATKETTESEEEDIEVIQALYTLLQEREIVPEKEIASWDDVLSEIDAYKTSLPKQIEEHIIESQSDAAKSLVKYALSKPNATREELAEFFQAEEEDINASNISTPEQAREYLKQQYSSQFDEDVLNTMLDTMEDKGTLETKAKEVVEFKAQKLQEQAAQEREQVRQQEEARYTSIAEEFDSQEWKPQHIKKVKEQWQTGKLDENLQKIANDPKSLVQLMNILSYYDEKTNSFNLDTFFTKASSKQTVSAKNALVASMQKRGSSTKPKKIQSNTTTFDELDLVL